MKLSNAPSSAPIAALVALVAAVAAVPTHAAVIVNENFDSVTAPALPAGWTGSAPAGSFTRTSTAQQVSGLNSAELLDNSTGTTTNALTRNFTSITGASDWVLWEFSFRQTTHAILRANLFDAVDGGGTSGLFVRTTAGGALEVRSGGASSFTEVQSVGTDTWYKVTIYANITANTFNVYVDDAFIAAGLAFGLPVTDFESMRFLTTPTPTGAIYIDDVRLETAVTPPAAVPAPSAAAMGLAALVGAAGCRRRRH